jgi:phage anti-repressor protein
MVIIIKQEDNFIFEVKGLHKLWALKSQITIPKENIINAYPNEENLDWIAGLRMPGTQIPGLITSGTYILKDGTIFCDVSDHKKSIVVQLKDEHYKKLIIEVENVEEAINVLKT